ncbi:hypothetical protein LMG28138_04654 [Pararobbsia alpina]|uniref:Uncharacterized protein n=1 Tax=Pararobbsia alpina TaxID=621374 RepID=A0A6S7C1V0_9BURK|nr:hypothetical protein LMG28138_04654 [Pararobbsia alpina]
MSLLLLLFLLLMLSPTRTWWPALFYLLSTQRAPLIGRLFDYRVEPDQPRKKAKAVPGDLSPRKPLPPSLGTNNKTPFLLTQRP